MRHLIKKNSGVSPIAAVFFGLCCVNIVGRLWHIRFPISQWWDPAIYIGMGKFLFSGGSLGFWETFRPPLWPIAIGAGWMAGFEPMLFAQILTVGCIILTLVLLYNIGEREEKMLGLIAAILFTLTPSYYIFTIIPTNDIAGALLVFCAAALLLKRKYFVSGLIAGFSFLMRYPQGMFLLPFSLFIFLGEGGAQECSDSKRAALWRLRAWLQLLAGFMCVFLPYGAVNQYFYKDFILPIRQGSYTLHSGSVHPWYYYLHELPIENPFLVFSVIGLAHFCRLVCRRNASPLLLLCFLCFCTGALFFFSIGHKELRYSYAFLLYLFVFAAHGVLVTGRLIRNPQMRYSAFALVGAAGFSFILNQTLHKTTYVGLSDTRNEFYHSIPSGGIVLTPCPQMLFGNDIKIFDLFSSWEDGLKKLRASNEFDYVDIDSCFLKCSDALCYDQKISFLRNLQSESDLIFNAKDENRCGLRTFKMRRSPA